METKKAQAARLAKIDALAIKAREYKARGWVANYWQAVARIMILENSIATLVQFGKARGGLGHKLIIDTDALRQF